MQRKLTAILSADVVGYSGMMEADETGTLERLKANRAAAFEPHVATHGGRVFKLMGDGALVEFSSVVAAVNCALAIQEATEKAGTDEAKPIRYRIGVNLGDIIIDGDDIYGEGVNVAARLQTLAPVGGIALSRVVRDQVKGKLPCEFDDMGEHTVKNIETPVHVFSVRAAGRTEPEGQKVQEPRKLSICVLPFANMSGDAEQEYFSDGISEDIITDLSKVSALAVISRNSAFQYKGKHIDLPKVARELKVSQVLEGSVRKAGGRVRITAQLIDGATNDHVWAERYDRDLNDIFALQDEISEAIVKALKLKLLPEERKAIEQRQTNSLEAYNLYLLAKQFRYSRSLANIRTSTAVIRLCQEAVRLDPNYAEAWVELGLALLVRANYGGMPDTEGLAAAERALTLNGSLAEAHAAKGMGLLLRDKFDEAAAELEIARGLAPESFDVTIQLGRLYTAQRQFNEAIPFYQKAVSLNEASYVSVYLLLRTQLAVGDTAGARRTAALALVRGQKALQLDPDSGDPMVTIATSLAILGEVERTKEMIRRGLLLDPDNEDMKSNFVRVFVLLPDIESALDLLRSMKLAQPAILNVFSFPTMELAPLAEHPRFETILAAAEARLAAENARKSSPPS